MKKIKFNQNKKTEDIDEICLLASKYFYVYTSPKNTYGEMEVADYDSNVDEALDNIRAEMDTGNQFKKSDNRTIKKIIRDHYLTVKLYGAFQFIKTAAADHSWDNAVFNGDN